MSNVVTKPELAKFEERMEDRFDKRFNDFEERIEKRFDEVLAVMSQFAQDVDKRFDDVDKRFDDVDKRFGSVDERFNGVDKRFDDVDKRLDDVDKQISGLDIRLARVEYDLEGVKQQIVDLQASHNHLINTIDGFVARISDYEAESAARDRQMERLLAWARKVSEKTGIPLEDL